MIKCPRCGSTSVHPDDVAAGYCGACHDWTSPADTGWLTMWTIYDHPLDHPLHFVAREWVLPLGQPARPTESVMISEDLTTLRERLLVDFGKVALARSPDDDPKIVETWI